MIHRLFVYGTLAPGRPNEHVLADVPGEWEPATVMGTSYSRHQGPISPKGTPPLHRIRGILET